MSESKIAIIGCGKMGSALAEKLAPHHKLSLYDRNQNHVDALASKHTITPHHSAADAIKDCDIVILAIKPQDIEDLALEISTQTKGKQLLVSILVGVSTKKHQEYFPDVPILRLMPSISITAGASVVGLVESDAISPELKTLTTSIFSSLGFLHWMKESHMDAFSALIGSGPAFVCVMIEAFTDAAIQMGFKPEEGYQLTLELLSGVVQVLKKSGAHPGETKWQVTSPAGITIEGINALENHNVRAGIMNATLAAFNKMQRTIPKQVKDSESSQS